jgi:hypothetical protein
VKSPRACSGYYIKWTNFERFYFVTGERGHAIPAQIALVTEHCSSCGRLGIWYAPVIGSYLDTRSIKKLATVNLEGSGKTGTFEVVKVNLKLPTKCSPL